MKLNADIVLERLESAPGPLRATDIWKVLWNAHHPATPSLSGVASALRTLEKRGQVTRKRRYDEDGNEMASHWTIKRGGE